MIRSVLAERLARSGSAAPRVVNAGIGGNRLLRDDVGTSGLRRFERDVLRRPGVRWVIVFEGINDLGFAASVEPEAPRVTAEELIAAYRQLIARARFAGVRIYAGTLLPFEGAASGYFAPDKELVRQAVNAWIRGSGELDGVVDFDAALRDPADPAGFAPGTTMGTTCTSTPAGTVRWARPWTWDSSGTGTPGADRE